MRYICDNDLHIHSTLSSCCKNPEQTPERLFSKAAALGVGIELNSSSGNPAPAQQESVLRMFRIAKRCGCKFYCSSDAHSPTAMESAKEVFEKIVDWLDLTEDDKFVI